MIGQGARVVAAVESIEMDGIDGTCAPQAQRVHPLALPADHRRVEGRGQQNLSGVPDVAAAAVLLGFGSCVATKRDAVGGLAPWKLPGVSVFQPVFRKFLLPAILDDLAKEAMLVADAITIGGDVEARHAFHEAGGKPSEAAIAKCSVGFQLLDEIEIDIEIAQRHAEGFGQFEIAERVAEQAADEKFKG